MPKNSDNSGTPASESSRHSASKSSSSGKSSDWVLRTLSILSQHSLTPLPIVLGTKLVADENYLDPEYQPDVDRWRTRDLGIGVLTGTDANLVDIDLDDKRSSFFASHFLPPTAWVFGRKSKPNSHYMYLATPDPIYGFRKIRGTPLMPTPDDGGSDVNPTSMIVELRHERDQTVMPGSVHTSGERVDWAATSPLYSPTPALLDIAPAPQKVSITVLDLAVRKIWLAVTVLDHAWHEGSRHAISMCFGTLFHSLGWPVEEAVHFLQAVQEHSGSKDRYHLRALRDTYAKRDEGDTKTIGGMRLTELLGSEAFMLKFRQIFPDPEFDAVEEYNSKYFTLNYAGEFRIGEWEWFNDLNYPTFSPFTLETLQKLKISDRVRMSGPNDNRLASKVDLWFRSPQRTTFSGARYEPGGALILPDNSINLWRGWKSGITERDEDHVSPSVLIPCDKFPGMGLRQEYQQAALRTGTNTSTQFGSYFWELVHDTICNADTGLFHWLLNWLAHMVQYPDDKPGTAFVMRSESEGVGKGTFARAIGREMLGHRYYQHVSRKDHFTGRFNSSLQYCALILFDEITFDRDRDAQILRSFISDDTMQYEAKGVDQFSGANYTRIMIASNEQQVVHRSATDRRYTITDIAGDAKSQEFYANLYDEIKGKDFGRRVMNDLLGVAVDLRVVRRPYETSAGQTHQLMSTSNVLSWIIAMLEGGEWTAPDDYWSHFERQPNEWPKKISKPALHAVYCEWCKMSRMRPLSAHHFGAEMNKYAPDYEGIECKMVRSGRKMRAISLPGRGYWIKWLTHNYPFIKIGTADSHESQPSRDDWCCDSCGHPEGFKNIEGRGHCIACGHLRDGREDTSADEF